MDSMEIFGLGVVVGMGAILAIWGYFELGRLREQRTLDRPWEQEWRTVWQRDR